jgi:putative endonuclease
VTAERRRRAWQSGRAAEWLTCWLLRAKGYRILGRGVRTPVGEIDVVARRGRVLVIVEVKRRTSHADAAHAVGARQRGRIERAAQLYLQRRHDLAGLEVRFDTVLAAPGRLPRHIANAWRPGDPGTT